MEELFRTLRHRMNWTNAKKILQANGISTSHGWDSTLKKIEDSGQQVNHGALEDALVEHLLCGEKFTKLYAVDPSLRNVIQNKLLSAEISNTPATKSYPHLMPDEELMKATGDMAIVRAESNEDGIGLMLSSVFWIRTREEIPFQEFDDPAGMKALYDEVVGLKRQPVQMFHVIWMPHERDFLEVRVDFPRGASEADVHGLHSVLKTIINSWGIVELGRAVNLFPAVRPFYEDATEGTVTQMTFQTTTGGIKDEKMPRRRANADQRTEAYHVAGKGAVEAIAIYRITVEWAFHEDGVSYVPSLMLSASGPAGNGTNGNPIVTGAKIQNCVRATDYEFVIDRLGKKAKLEVDSVQ
ncbi:hypothetical protein EQ718_08210 [Paracoccus versutus]|uniref:Uncharacterized protein n=1 Tax=Paracoccus versutus TaxID=34007 RepID=A0AAQ0KM95_PARVE|nr:hypothetical protein [Paracoccus versutus]REG53169.1 hypothetical protein ATH84_100766 [Paracoccus versutus]WEJ78864.1 hypothetical protein EQ718_08210 [Paracoccus versutus]